VSPTQKQAFTTLKAEITNVPNLRLPDFNQPFIVDNNASIVVEGAILSKANHPIAFFCKEMCPHLKSASVYVRDMYAITEAIKKWR